MKKYLSLLSIIFICSLTAVYADSTSLPGQQAGTKTKTEKLAKEYASTTVSMYLTASSGKGEFIGNVTFTDTEHGLLISPNLKDLTTGLHGFHIHKNPDCSNNGNAAGGHFDPGHTGKHFGPYKRGHLGDLPALYADEDGLARLPILAPRLTVKDLYGHAVMIHVDGDNYSDYPRKLGGGGARFACGVVHKL